MQQRAGTWNGQEAEKEIRQFYEKLNRMGTGDTLRNLMLSGQDEKGRDQTNALTWLFLKAYGETKDGEPHLNVRIHENTPGKLKKECIRLLARGNGQPTLYFDENIIPAMENSGVPRYDACRYAYTLQCIKFSRFQTSGGPGEVK